MSLKNSWLSALPLETVWGAYPSRLRRILFFSSTENFLGPVSSCSRRWMVSTDVTKHSFFSAQYMQDIQMLFCGRSLTGTGWNVVFSVLPTCFL